MVRKHTRRARRSSSNSGQIVLGILLMAVSAVIVMGMVYLYLKTHSNVHLDEAMCPVNGPNGVTVFLVDTTDPLSQTTFIDVKNRLNSKLESANVGERIEILGLTEYVGELTELFSGCKPDDGSDASGWTNNPRLMRQDWERFFSKPLAQVSNNLKNSDAGNQSPIMAGIQSIKLNIFDKYKAKKYLQNLIIISDMIEHTNSFSLYRDDANYTTFKSSPAYHDYRTDLTGVAVEIWFIDRGNAKFRKSSHMDFWLNWINGNLGELQKAISLEGISVETK